MRRKKGKGGLRLTLLLVKMCMELYPKSESSQVQAQLEKEELANLSANLS